MEETISLKEIFEVIKKRFLMIMLFILGAALIAAVVSYFILTPTYQSSSQFIVNQKEQDPNAQVNVNDIRTNVELINTYNVIIKSKAILDDVVSELGLPYGASTLESKIEVSSEQNSQVVTVTATDPSQEIATQIANTTVQIFQEKTPEIMNGVDNVGILSEAEVVANPTPVAPKPMLNIAIAVVLGAMVGVGLAFLLEYLDNTITTEEDIEKRLGIPLIGVISSIQEEDIRSEQFSIQTNRMKRSRLDGATKKTI